MKVLRWIYKVLRSVLVTLLLLALVVPAVLFVGLSLPGVQNSLRQRAEHELTNLLGAPVSIGSVGISPFSSVTLRDVAVADSLGAKALTVKRLGAGIDVMRLLRGDIRVTYAELMGLNANIYRANDSARLNIQPIIDRLSPKDKNKPPTKFDLAITTVVIRKSELHYNVLSAPETQGRMNPRHLAVYDLKADVTLPRVSNSETIVDVKRLAFTVENAVTVKSLSGRASIRPDMVAVTGLDIELPRTRLAFSDLSVPLKGDWRSMPLAIQLMPGSAVNPSDLSGIVPGLAAVDETIGLRLEAEGTPSYFVIHTFEAVTPDNKLAVRLGAQLSGLPDGPDNATLRLPRLDVRANAARALSIVKAFAAVNPKTESIIASLGDVDLSGQGGGSLTNAEFTGGISTAVGAIDLHARMERKPLLTLSGHVTTDGIDLASLSPQFHAMAPLGLDAEASFTAGRPEERRGMFSGQIRHLTWKGYTYSDIIADLTLTGTLVEGNVTIDDPYVGLTVSGDAVLPPGATGMSVVADISHFNPNALGLTAKYPGYQLDAHVEAVAEGSTVDNVTGHLTLADIAYANPSDSELPSLHVSRFAVVAATDSLGRDINIDGDILRGSLTGRFSFATLGAAVKGIAARINPELFPDGEAEQPLPDDNLDLHLTILPDNPLEAFIKLPVGIIAPVNLSAHLDSSTGHMSTDLVAPYLRQKDKLIEGTAFHLDARGPERTALINAATMLPTKAGPMTLSIDSHGFNGSHDTQIEWNVANRPNYGDLRFTTSFDRNPGLTTRIDVNPGRIVFNDTVWTVAPSRVTVADNRVRFDNFRVSHRDQLVSIRGEASRDSTSELTLQLRDINLDYVFETLNIPNVMFGGNATGTFHASNLFSGRPVAFTDNLFVKNLSYNRCVMGDGHIRSAYNADKGDISINAVIDEPDSRKSYIDGTIHPTKELLDFHFRADRAPVGFLQPFMAAFCDGISGYASGEAHLFGTFKLLDMTGDIYGEDLAMHIGFTNTTYHTSDSVHIAPGRIELKDVVIADDRGKTARLSGLLTHKDFKEPRFTFRITDARDLLAYDIAPNSEHPWYGKVYGTGSVTISGEPGLVNIGVDMATAEGTDFTFVLSDEEVAADYNFLTFRDKTPARPVETKDTVDAEPPMVTALRNRIAKMNQDSPTAYSMTFNIDVTPRARVTLVMDPVGGDKIRATGSGNLRMSYDSANEELKMYGTYTLQQGSYNFTLQDIIIKDFTIENGSSITFHGDPYSALLNIRAYYALNANLSDLDESFLQDRELNRTNVPVHAVMNVTGDMRSPDISFDLEFPTLTQDTYRKVRSIVSTDDMMNRQIIYLLALNRFYTPDYMEATRGNELVSVASSTISSQLSNMLGQLSDKFSIAPSFRSDRGDFSDVEVDVALSSHLLNNRLLLNGNFGYRDKSLNDNSFIGDFDIEYLLNRSGSIRLKAYNRYNDQNYYLKSALTTQGVGVVFKRDFDYFFDFVRRLRRKMKRTPADTTTTTVTPTPPTDSIDNGKLSAD